MYENPPDGIPKIHVRSSKYMAWIAENNLPVHLHVKKVCFMFSRVVLNVLLEGKVFAI